MCVQTTVKQRCSREPSNEHCLYLHTTVQQPYMISRTGIVHRVSHVRFCVHVARIVEDVGPSLVQICAPFQTMSMPGIPCLYTHLAPAGGNSNLGHCLNTDSQKDVKSSLNLPETKRTEGFNDLTSNGMLRFTLYIYIYTYIYMCIYSETCLNRNPYIPETWTNGK